MLNSTTIKQRAAELGFNLVGITRAEPSPMLDAYLRWVDAGMHGSMHYMARPDRQARRKDLNVIVPNARSLIIVALDYHTQHLPAHIANDPRRGRIAAYAWGIDYHDLMTPRLQELADWLRSFTPNLQQRVYVDTGAILERSHAQQAGMGFVGKNTLLIHPQRGSYFFLGEIITDAECDQYDQPHRVTMCGSCTRCQTSCPTNAFPQPYVLDARRCISYLTIEHKSWIEPELRPLIGHWLMGCDVCQDVCPWQKFAVQTQESAFFPVSIDRAAPLLSEMLGLDEIEFMRRFAGSPIERIKRERLVRNACIAAGNAQLPEFVPLLIQRLADQSAIIRGHAAWALSRYQQFQHLHDHLNHETDDHVRGEIQRVLARTT